jgi:hypothetical protein
MTGKIVSMIVFADCFPCHWYLMSIMIVFADYFSCHWYLMSIMIVFARYFIHEWLYSCSVLITILQYICTFVNWSGSWPSHISTLSVQCTWWRLL